MKLPILISLLTIAGIPSGIWGAESAISERDVIDRTFSLAKHYFTEFQHPETSVLYNARLSGKDSWTSPADVLAEKPKPWGYGSRIADTSLHTGHILTALLDAYAARPDPFLKAEIYKCFAALKLIGSLPETHPKAGKPALEGLVPRGPHPNNLTATARNLLFHPPCPFVTEPGLEGVSLTHGCHSRQTIPCTLDPGRPVRHPAPRERRPPPKVKAETGGSPGRRPHQTLTQASRGTVFQTGEEGSVKCGARRGTFKTSVSPGVQTNLSSGHWDSSTD